MNCCPCCGKNEADGAEFWAAQKYCKVCGAAKVKAWRAKQRKLDAQDREWITGPLRDLKTAVLAVKFEVPPRTIYRARMWPFCQTQGG